MAYLLPLAPLGIAIVGIFGLAPYWGQGRPCEPYELPLAWPILIETLLVGADPDQPIVDEKLPFEGISFLLGCSC
jgi:hypothetical protein